ncbi:Peptidase M20 domain-containing protein 2 [Hypsibius exemplaris]|uniref:Peptidase M20 domain-containing protein 2 n=1 Tax=Hypsibius exemplaris TaxID=2072580 RepID=A0A1W0WBB4_HYPEX|nr:Peptidase M20 domain-containing protein 2 [Hypsibius exemplaris]
MSCELSSSSASAFQADKYETLIFDTIKAKQTDLTNLGETIWNDPEEALEEVRAAKLLTDYLQTIDGVSVECNFKGLPTAFLASWTKNPVQKDEHYTTVAVLCEYDALPEIGHACGHNLIAEAGIACFVAAVAAAKQSGAEGKIVCMGTPAEESGAGKVKLIQKGAFKDVDFAMMVHSAPVDMLAPPMLAVDHCSATFTGKASHASAGPFDGINALDACVSAYNNLSMARQQLKPNHQIHMIISKGGSKPNVIPDSTKMDYYIRAPNGKEMVELREKTTACFQAAKLATGCLNLQLDGGHESYGALLTNKTMLGIYEHYGLKHGMHFHAAPAGGGGSTDMGNVSIEVPSIHPLFNIQDPAGEQTLTMIHTVGFQALAGQPAGHLRAGLAGGTMAMLVMELLLNESLRKKVKKEFEEEKRHFIA